MKRCEPVGNGLRFYVVVAFLFAKVLESVWTVLNRFTVWGSFFIFGAKAINQCEPAWTALRFYVFVTFSWAKKQKAMNRCEPVWTALRFYVVVTFLWAKVLKWVWTGLNWFMAFFEQKPWNGVNRFKPVYAFTLLWHFCLLKSLNRFEPVWTGLRFWVPFIFGHFFEQKAMNRCEPVWTALRFYVVVSFSWAKVLKSVWTGLNRFMVFFEQKPWNRVNRFEPVYVFTLLWHFRLLKSLNRSEPVWTGFWMWVPFDFLSKKPWIGVNRFEPLYVFTLLWHFRGLKSLNRSEPVWTGLWYFF